MVKFTFCMRRKPGMSRQEFLTYWSGHHAELAKSYAKVLNIRRYVQLHTLDHPLNDVIRKTRGTMEPFDGIAETWYDSLESLEQGFSTPAGREAGRKLREDEANFVDLSRTAGWVSEEKVFIKG
ncbi:MAG: EthD domain-containing protein [Candidatus Lambdaproteobacteria bacterium]|nr:EthD domain-containing protein [Candidatus Lambdaproteobacteria bacterium]